MTKKGPLTVQSSEVTAGNPKQFECKTCNREFEITLEPKAKKMTHKPADAANVLWCPFCGEKPQRR